jgi:hypothetical protein
MNPRPAERTPPSSLIGLIWAVFELATSKQGLWGAVVVGVLGVGGYESHLISASYRSYIDTQSQNTKTIQDGVIATQSAVLSNGQMIAANHDKIQVLSEALNEMRIMQASQGNILENASKMMAPVPAKHDMQIKILEQIRDGMSINAQAFHSP